MAEETRPRRGFQIRKQDLQNPEVQSVHEDFGDLEYVADLMPYLDPVARFGIDPTRARVTPDDDSYEYSLRPTQNLDRMSISRSLGLMSKNTQAHEWRHRGFVKLYEEYLKNREFYDKKYGADMGAMLRGIVEAGTGPSTKNQSWSERKGDLSEIATEFFEKPEDFNMPAGYKFSDGTKTGGYNSGIKPMTAAYERENPQLTKVKIVAAPSTSGYLSDLETYKQEQFREYLKQPEDERENLFFDAVLKTQDFAKDLSSARLGGEGTPSKYAQGGEVMQGVGSLNETARNMFRGPRGIGAYQQFASGGEAMGPPPTRGPDPQGIGAYQQFADGGPVYMQEGGDPTMRQKLLSVIYDVESDGDYDQWNYAAKNIPETPITDMTVEQIMRYQGDENGPAAGAGQIKFNTFKTLLKMDDGLLPTDVFTPEVQDHANNRLLDRRGFNAWSRGEKSSFDFANDLASEWAGLPLVRDTTKTTGEVRKAGQSRYNNNSPGISANNWLSAVASAFGDEVPDQIGPAAPVYKSTPVFSNSPEGDLDLAMYAEDYGFQTPTGFTPTLRPQLRPQGIMSIQDPAVMDRVVAQVQEELPPTQEERDLYEKYSPENMFPDAGLTEGEMIRRERFAPKDGDAEPYRQPLNLTTP